MKKLLILSILFLTISKSLAAEENRKELKRTELSEQMEVINSVAEYKKGDSIKLHFHHGIEVVYVIQGATIKPKDKDPIEIKTGASLTNLRDQIHAGFTVVSDEPLKIFTVHIVDKNKPLYEYVNK